MDAKFRADLGAAETMLQVPRSLAEHWLASSDRIRQRATEQIGDRAAIESIERGPIVTPQETQYDGVASFVVHAERKGIGRCDLDRAELLPEVDDTVPRSFEFDGVAFHANDTCLVTGFVNDGGDGRRLYRV